MTDIAKLALSALLKFDGYADELALPREQRRRYRDRASAVATALETLQRERDEAREALDRADRYLQFVASWAWRDSDGLTDEGRLSAIKFYPPIKALVLTESDRGGVLRKHRRDALNN